MERSERLLLMIWAAVAAVAAFFFFAPQEHNALAGRSYARPNEAPLRLPPAREVKPTSPKRKVPKAPIQSSPTALATTYSWREELARKDKRRDKGGGPGSDTHRTRFARAAKSPPLRPGTRA